MIGMDRLRTAYGSRSPQEALLRHRREGGEAMDRDDDWAWPNRRMLSNRSNRPQHLRTRRPPSARCLSSLRNLLRAPRHP